MVVHCHHRKEATIYMTCLMSLYVLSNHFDANFREGGACLVHFALQFNLSA